MIIGAIFFYVAYLILWRHNKETRNVTTEVLDKSRFERYFNDSLDSLIERKILKEVYEKTQYFYYALGCLLISVLCVCVKLANLL